MWTPPTSIPTTKDLVAAIDATVAGLAVQKQRLASVLVRHALAAANDDDSQPYNVLVLGPTGGGKTHLVRAACTHLGLPWIEVNALQYSAVGYYGADLPEMFLGFFEAPWMEPGDKLREAIPVMERWGVVILDELDKWRVPPRKPGQAAPEGREFGRAEQNELLKIVEGDYLPLSRQRDQRGQNAMRTHHLLFIALGAFEGLNEEMERAYQTQNDMEYMRAEPEDIHHYGFTMELCGRFPMILPLPPLDPLSMGRIFREHIYPRYQRDAHNLGCEFVVEDAAIMEIAGRAVQKHVGARGFPRIMEEMCALAFYQARPGDRIVLGVDEVLRHTARIERRRAA